MADKRKENIKISREKQLAIIKAQNEMLEDAKQTVIERLGEDSDSANDIIDKISTAQDENTQMGKMYLGASSNEISNAKYGEASKFEIEKYERHLKKKGITDKMLKEKDLTKLTDIINETNAEDGKLLKRFTKKLKSLVDDEKPVIINDDEEVVVFDPKKRTEKGIGYIEEEKENIEKTNKKLAEVVEEATKIEETEKKNENVSVFSTFDPSSIPDYVQYDIIPLPSEGKCYPIDSPLRSGRIAVAYLTASDENLIASPNMYKDNLLIDTIVRRKILDKSINPDNLVRGDKDAIVLWLRATAYGDEFPILARNPKNPSKQYEKRINLSSFKYLPFNIISDNNGHFDYTTTNGDKIKFKIPSDGEYRMLENEMRKTLLNESKSQIIDYIDKISSNIASNDNIDKDDLEILNQSCDNIMTWANTLPDKDIESTVDNFFANESVTMDMKNYTVSINGNSNKDFVSQYIDNMRAGESKKYREYVKDNMPGVDFRVKIEIPEVDGGGSFTTFLSYDNGIFINI